MFDKIFQLFRKADQAMGAAESMQRTAQKVEYQTQNVSNVSASGKKWKWILLIVILAVAALYVIFG